MKKLFLILLVLISACAPAPVPPTPTPTATAEPTAVTAVAVQPTAEPGSEGNPLILALAPTAHPTEDLIKAGNGLAARLSSLTGYKIVTAAPASEKELLQAFALGNAQIAVLSPYGYVLASREGLASALLSRVRDGKPLYATQFLARLDEGFKSYYDSALAANTANAAQALSQFKERKPCWSDATSPSSYVVPLGILNEAAVPVQEPAFVEGQSTVVRAVYGKGICDFGATYIDARLLPGLEVDYPDVLEKVAVIWVSEAVIPYEAIVTSATLNPEIRRSLLRAFIDIMNTTDGKLLIQTVYGIDAFQPADDTLYQPFSVYVDESGLDVNTLVR